MNILLILITIVVGKDVAVTANEPQCSCSKFHYEEKMMEKMVRLEFIVENMKTDIYEARTSVMEALEEFRRLKTVHENNVQQTLRKSEDTMRPAFTARLSKHMLKLGNKQPIVFDNILTNTGQAYSGVTGVFTVPSDGLYFFIATVMSLSGQYVQTEIVRNGESMVKMFSLDKSHEQGTSAVVLSLTTSDEVWVRHLNSEGENVYGHNWSTFSGFQM